MFFFFNDTATTEIYTLSLHDALPIYRRAARDAAPRGRVPLSRSGNRRGASADRRDAAVRCGGDARLGWLADRWRGRRTPAFHQHGGEPPAPAPGRAGPCHAPPPVGGR